MAQITKIEPQKKKGRFNIYLDNKFLLGVSEEVIVALNLKEGQEIDQKKVKDFEKKEEETKVYLAALRFLSYRLRSQKEVKDKLSQKFPPKLVEKTLRRLKKEKLLDDVQFARAFVKNREILRPTGSRRIFFELRQKGVEEELIKKILEKDYNQDRELAAAIKAGQKKLKSFKNLPKDKIYQKMVGFLARRGFNFQTIKRAFDALHQMV